MIKLPSFGGGVTRSGLWIGPVLCLASSLWAGETLKESAPGSAHKSDTPTEPRPANSFLNNLSTRPSFGAGFVPGNLPNAPAPAPNSGQMDPEVRKRWMLANDKERNWLLENAALLNTKSKPGVAATEDPGDKFNGSDAVARAAVNRMRRATQHTPDKATATNPETDTDPSDPTRESARKEKRNEPGEFPDDPDREPNSPKAALALTSSSLSASDRAFANPGRTEGGFFTTPTRTAGEDRQHERLSERDAAFDRMLGGIGGGPSSSLADISRQPPTRAQQFDALLGGGEAARPAAFGNPLATPATAAGTTLAPSFDRLAPSLSPSTGPNLLPAAPARFQPRPVVLQIPMRGL